MSLLYFKVFHTQGYNIPPNSIYPQRGKGMETVRHLCEEGHPSHARNEKKTDFLGVNNDRVKIIDPVAGEG